LLFDFAEREINELTNFEYDTLLFNFSVANGLSVRSV